MKLCTQCLNQVEPKKVVRGYFVIEIILWLAMILPGAIYTLWRVIGGRQETCPKCQGHNFVPIDSPAGVALLSKVQQTQKAA